MCQSPFSPTKEGNCGTPRIFVKLPSFNAVEISTEGYATRARIVSDTIDKLKKEKKTNIGALRLQLPDPFRASSISLEGSSAVERRRFEGAVGLFPPSRREIDRSLPAANSRSSDGTRGGYRGGEENNMSRTFRRWLVHRARDVKQRRVILRKEPGRWTALRPMESSRVGARIVLLL